MITKRTYTNFHKNSILILMLLFGFALFAQNNTTKYNVFYSDTPIYLSDGAVLDVQMQHIFIQQKMQGKGLFVISDTPAVTLIVSKPITSNVLFKNTKVSLHNELAIAGDFTITQAEVLLNDFDLISDKPILDNTGLILENGNGTLIIKKLLVKGTASNDAVVVLNSFSAAFIAFEKMEAGTDLAYYNNQKNVYCSVSYVSIDQIILSPPPKLI